MGAAVFFGCAFVAFGPAFALFLLTVAGDPLRVIILVAGAFFWLVSLLLASVVWFLSVQWSDRSDARLQTGLLLFGAAVAVLLQEAFRFAYYKLLKKADEGLASLSEDGRSPISIRQMAYVSGLSFGIISGVFSVINILADALGPGIVGIHGDSPHYFLTSDVPEPPVRGQPAARLRGDRGHGAVGLRHGRRLPRRRPTQLLVRAGGGQRRDDVLGPSLPHRGLSGREGGTGGGRGAGEAPSPRSPDPWVTRGGGGSVCVGGGETRRLPWRWDSEPAGRG
uniref:Gamma-secretase subunit APH-1 n=1 Tax=Ornithorhynchus anatinus TaxID=9258 RepID=A0A6I8P129_ORNAN